jgi:trans-aconitate 2-methyltransferase
MGQTGLPHAMRWNPAQYLAFASHRLRPALELLARVPHEAPRRVVDLGCGSGNVTGYLRRQWPAADITGVDNSPEMLARAAQEAIPGAPVRWQAADLAAWTPEQPCEVIYSNAALHWIGDHARQFPRLIGQLAPQGVLAVQMPRNFAAPSHALMTAAAQAGPWRARLQAHIHAAPVAEPQAYYDLLAPLCAAVDVWETEYQQVLTGDNPVAEFTKGSWLKSLLDALHEPERSQFEAEYRRLVLDAYPKRHGGETLFPFKRLFIVAQVA